MTLRVKPRYDATHLTAAQVAELNRRQAECAHPEERQVEMTEMKDAVRVYRCTDCGWQLTREDCSHSVTTEVRSEQGTRAVYCDSCGADPRPLASEALVPEGTPIPGWAKGYFQPE